MHINGFNNDGPTAVGHEDFTSFISLTVEATFDQMFYMWINENILEGVRILCLRDLLRQTTLNYATRSFHQTGEDLSRFITVDRKFFWQLRNRPKLLNELNSELRYVLENSLLPPQQSAQTSIDQLIELITPFVDEENGRALSHYHSVWGSPRKAGDFSSVLAQWGYAYYPDWLRRELWVFIEDAIRKEAKIYRQELQENCSMVELRANTAVLPTALMCTIKYIGHISNKAAETLAQLIELLEECLPKHFGYNALEEVVRNAKMLENAEIAYAYVRRHLLNASADDVAGYASSNHHAWFTFLMWCYGINQYYSANDQELMNVLEEYIECLNAMLHASTD